MWLSYFLYKSIIYSVPPWNLLHPVENHIKNLQTVPPIKNVFFQPSKKSTAVQQPAKASEVWRKQATDFIINKIIKPLKQS